MPAPVVHFEIGCRDAKKTGDFYSKLFGWKLQAFSQSQMIDTGSKEGIAGHINALGHEPHNYITVYVQVDDLQKYLNRAKELGGKTIVPPQEVPGMGHFAWLADPEGTIVGIWKSMTQGK
jgi:predicted enzyme related to lactoylglutathione lyase